MKNEDVNVHVIAIGSIDDMDDVYRKYIRITIDDTKAMIHKDLDIDYYQVDEMIDVFDRSASPFDNN